MAYPDFGILKFKNIRGVTCMALNPSVVTLEGYNATLRPDISLDNVQFDNLNPEVGVASEFATFNLGPGAVNFGDVLDAGAASTSCRTAATGPSRRRNASSRSCRRRKPPAGMAPLMAPIDDDASGFVRSLCSARWAA